MLLMLMGLALAVQDVPDLTPGGCHQAGVRFATFAPAVQEFLDKDALDAREGRPTQLNDEERARVTTAIIRDRKALVVVQRRYADAVPNDQEVAMVAAMEGADVGRYVRRCGES